MSSEFSIQGFLGASEEERNRRVEIRGKIVSCQDSGLFMFADVSGSVLVKAPSQFAAQIHSGKFVKLINPKLETKGDKIMLLDEKSRIFPSRKIKELEDYKVKMEDDNECPTLAMLAELDPEQKVSEIRVMILKDLGINRVTQRKIPVKKLLVKDKHGTDRFISVWTYFIEKVQVGKIYKITNMRVEKHPKEKPHQLSTTNASKIVDITDEKKEEFKGVSLADGSVNGIVEVVHGIYKYHCCPKCKCKADDSMIRCATCDAILHEKMETFKYVLCLNIGNDDMLEMTGFSSSATDVVSLPLPLPSTDDIEDIMNNDLENKDVEVEFTFKNLTKEKIVHKITVKN